MKDLKKKPGREEHVSSFLFIEHQFRTKLSQGTVEQTPTIPTISPQASTLAAVERKKLPFSTKKSPAEPDFLWGEEQELLFYSLQ